MKSDVNAAQPRGSEPEHDPAGDAARDARWHKTYLAVVVYTALIIFLLALFSRYYAI